MTPTPPGSVCRRSCSLPVIRIRRNPEQRGIAKSVSCRSSIHLNCKKLFISTSVISRKTSLHPFRLGISARQCLVLLLYTSTALSLYYYFRSIRFQFHPLPTTQYGTLLTRLQLMERIRLTKFRNQYLNDNIGCLLYAGRMLLTHSYCSYESLRYTDHTRSKLWSVLLYFPFQGGCRYDASNVDSLPFILIYLAQLLPLLRVGLHYPWASYPSVTSDACHLSLAYDSASGYSPHY